jgi:hypothetical protein
MSTLELIREGLAATKAKPVKVSARSHMERDARLLRATRGHPAPAPARPQEALDLLSKALDSDDVLGVLDSKAGTLHPADKLPGGRQTGPAAAAAVTAHAAWSSSRPAEAPSDAAGACCGAPAVYSWPGMLDLLLGCIRRHLKAHKKPIKMFDTAYGR